MSFNKMLDIKQLRLAKKEKELCHMLKLIIKEREQINVKLVQESVKF